MRKGDKGKKVFGVILILAIIVSVFGGVVSAENVSGGLKQSVDDAEIQTAVGNLSSEELTEALDDDPLHQLPSTSGKAHYVVADGYAWSGGTANPSGAISTGDKLRVGFSTAYGDYRTLIKFDLSSIPAGATITSADLKLYYYAYVGTVGDPLDISVYRTTVDWNEGYLSWSKAENYNSFSYDTVTIIVGSGAGYKTWDITALVQNWVDGTYSNYGVLLRAPPQSESSIYRTFRSKEYGSNVPKLEVTYTEIPTPVITGIDPPEPTASPTRQWISILGTGFVSDSTVTLRIGSETYPIPADRTDFISSTEIRVYVGLTDPGTWSAQVTNPGSRLSNIFSFTVVPEIPTPVITGIEPPEPVASPTRQWISILGTGFVSDSTVTLRIGSETYPIPADRTDFISSTEIRVYVGLTDPGTWSAQVTNPGSRLSNIFSFTVVPEIPTPVITGIEPPEPVASPTRQWISILGTGFVSDSTVTLRIGSETYPIPADRTDFISSTEIRVYVGLTDPGTWSAQVTNPGSRLSNIFSFTVVPEIPTPVTLTLYVHEGSASGPLLSGVQVTGQDGAGNSFDKTTGTSGYVTITGTPGTWQFRISKSGYVPKEWELPITTTCTRDAYFSENVYYGPQAAVNYAINYAYKACGCGGYYGSSPPPQGSGTPLGSNGDCAHFVSHCLAAGELSNKGSEYATGWCEGGAHDYIISVSKMRDWFTETGIATKVSSVNQLVPGDVIVTNSYGHVVLYIGSYDGKNHQVASHSAWGIFSYTYFGTPNEYWHITSASLTDQQKQQEMLNSVNSHRGSLPAELVLAIICQEGGEGAFHVDGWNYNTFYRESDGPWAQPTNGDGIMQVSATGNPYYHERSGPYTHDWTGYDHAINDGCDYLLELYSSYATRVQSTLHYNTGPKSLYIYLGMNQGDRDYLSKVAEHLSSFVPNTYGLSNQNLVNALNQGQNILDKYLYDMGIATGQSVGYYEPYQTQLDSELHNIETPNDPPNKPSIQSGPTLGQIGISYTYSTVTTDPNTDNVYYWFDWRDDTNSGWIGPYPSGTSGSASKEWNDPGTYNVKAKAKDEYGAESSPLWSDSLPVCINGLWENDPINPCKKRRLSCTGEYEYQNKDDGTICGCTASNTLKTCYSGVCTDTGICDATTCGADAACDGKRPGDSCGGGICDSVCKCGGQAVGEDYGIYSAPLWFVDKNGDHLADDVFGYGFTGATPLVGDFNQDGADDIAVFSAPLWFVDTNGDHVADDVFGYGFAGATPLVGDINQDGTDDIAVFCDGLWFVDTNGDHIADDVFGYGFAGATPLVGDFNQDGADDIAVFCDGLWFVDTNGDHIADDVFGYGFAGATPLVGDINQDGTDDIAVFSDGLWFVDTNGDHLADDVFGYGFAGATPIVGDIG